MPHPLTPMRTECLWPSADCLDARDAPADFRPTPCLCSRWGWPSPEQRQGGHGQPSGVRSLVVRPGATPRPRERRSTGRPTATELPSVVLAKQLSGTCRAGDLARVSADCSGALADPFPHPPMRWAESAAVKDGLATLPSRRSF